MPRMRRHNVCMHDEACFCTSERKLLMPPKTKKTLPDAAPLQSNQGLRIRGFVSGFSAKNTEEGKCIVTIQAGKEYNDTNMFSITVPYQTGFELVGQDVDIIVVPTGPRFPDTT